MTILASIGSAYFPELHRVYLKSMFVCKCFKFAVFGMPFTVVVACCLCSLLPKTDIVGILMTLLDLQRSSHRALKFIFDQIGRRKEEEAQGLAEYYEGLFS